jgi:hypothetical protein
MTRVDTAAHADVQLRDLEVMFLKGKLTQANRQLVQAFDRNDTLAAGLAERRPGS